VYLATDPDREGEAISWHLSKALKLEDKDIYRITFNEITKSAVKAAIKDARKIDMNLVDAQQARRVLDRVVGYSISPVLWAKIKRGLSAGRVQSVALRIICDRENEIDAFIPDEYWTMDATLKVKGEKKPIVARFHGDVNGKIDIKNKEQMETIKKEVENSTFAVDSIKKGEKVKKAPLPFTTSTLQQEASKTLNFATAKTMRIAQQLYEGVDVDGRGTIGVITYLRTDSTRVADEAKEASEQYIAANYGEKYLPHSGLRKKDDKKIQDAHEAIRPTDIALTPVMIKDSLSRDQFRLYQLIWKRFTASQMAEAIYETTSVKIAAGDYRFSIAASKITFDGFMSVYRSDDDKDEPNALVKGIDEDSQLTLEGVEGVQHFTQPPKQYTEDTLLSAMERAGNEELTEDTEKKGLGTPATRAAIIEKLIQSGFVKREKKNLVPTDDGNVLITVLPDEIKSPKMTAEWEMALNHIAQNTETADEFLNGITELMQELVARYKGISEEKKNQFQGKAKGEVIGKCPRCGADVREGKVNFYCSDRNCAFTLWKNDKFLASQGKKMDKVAAKKFLSKGKIHYKDLVSRKTGRQYEATVEMVDPGEGNVQFNLSFPQR